MTFAYLGYLWALLGCSLLAVVCGGLGVLLYVVGRRAERRGPRAIVETVPVSPARGSGEGAGARLPGGAER